LSRGLRDAHGQCDYERKSLFGITSPFGGTKQSGLGRRSGTDGFEEYLGSKPSAYPTETTTVDVQEISD
jgi:acyl-CoA reductase-like NAD-dependent aldehyde dehydrogenase